MEEYLLLHTLSREATQNVGCHLRRPYESRVTLTCRERRRGQGSSAGHEKSRIKAHVSGIKLGCSDQYFHHTSRREPKSTAEGLKSLTQTTFFA